MGAAEAGPAAVNRGLGMVLILARLDRKRPRGDRRAWREAVGQSLIVVRAFFRSPAAQG
jgi:hypothetical protein